MSEYEGFLPYLTTDIEGKIFKVLFHPFLLHLVFFALKIYLYMCGQFSVKEMGVSPGLVTKKEM